MQFHLSPPFRIKTGLLRLLSDGTAPLLSLFHILAQATEKVNISQRSCRNFTGRSLDFAEKAMLRGRMRTNRAALLCKDDGRGYGDPPSLLS
jgi:hypothetical protein